MMWSEKYRPQSVSAMIGNEDARSAITEWFAKWKRGSKALLLVGPPGIGKTTAAGLAGTQFGYDVIGLNASDARSKSRINAVLEPVLGGSGILGRQMIFVDEVDGIHGRSDFGGAEALIRIIKEAQVPIVLAANSDASAKMKGIKKAAMTVPFRPIPPRLLRAYLRHILNKEGAKLSPGSEIKVIGESRGDVRSMINLAQSLAAGFDPKTDRSIESPAPEDGINAFFEAKTADEARSILYSMRIDPREKINAFYSSIIMADVSKREMSRMMQVMSEADLLYGRIFRTQQWRLLRYLDAILEKLYGRDLAVRYSQYNLSWPLLNRLRWDGRTLKRLFGVLGARMHVSRSAFGTLYFPFLLLCIKNKKLDLQIDDEFSGILDKEMAKL